MNWWCDYKSHTHVGDYATRGVLSVFDWTTLQFGHVYLHLMPVVQLNPLVGVNSGLDSLRKAKGFWRVFSISSFWIFWHGAWHLFTAIMHDKNYIFNSFSSMINSMCLVRWQPLRSVHVSDLTSQQNSPSETRTFLGLNSYKLFEKVGWHSVAEDWFDCSWKHARINIHL